MVEKASPLNHEYYRCHGSRGHANGYGAVELCLILSARTAALTALNCRGLMHSKQMPQPHSPALNVCR